MTEPQLPQPEQPQPRRKGSPPMSTLVLAGVLVLALGFVGGIGVSRLTASGGEPAATGKGPRVMQTDGPAGAAGNATVGTVERVAGDTVYVKTPEGKTIKVSTDDDTEVRVSKKGSVSDLTKGTGVVVSGEKDGDTVNAKNIDAGGRLPGKVMRTSKP